MDITEVTIFFITSFTLFAAIQAIDTVAPSFDVIA